MANETSIANGALVKLGQQLITSINDSSSNAANICKERISNAKEVVLTSFPFNGAVSRVTLAADVATPAYDYSNQFTLPSDCLRLITVEPAFADTDYALEGRKILFSGDTLEIIYIKNITDYNELDPLVNESISCYLAYDIAYLITNDNQTTERMMQMYEKTIKKAKAANNRQLKKLSFYAANWSDARLVGGYPSQYPTPTT
jgi:hypothetical protein